MDKIKLKTLSSIPKYQEYLKLNSNKKNRLATFGSSVVKRKENIKKLNIKDTINSLDGLDTRCKNILWDKNIKTIEELLQYSKKDLSLFKRLGPFAVLEIEKAIEKYGFVLKEE